MTIRGHSLPTGRIRRITGVALAVMVLLAATSVARDPQEALVLRPGGKVVEIVDGDTVILQDGRQVRLVGLQAPKLPLGRENFQAWPLAEEAKQALSDMVLGEEVTLGFGGRRGDRHGRVLAHLFGPDGTWIQGRLLERGMARVYSFADNRALLADMLAYERDARRSRKGIWADDFYGIRQAAEADAHVGAFALVEGRVREIGEARGLLFLNYGDDWRSDFTLVLDRAAQRLFREANLDPRAYHGRLLRARGWLKERNGPMIDISHPEQIEVLD